IIAQVTKGKNAMPAFGKRLKPNQIQDVAAYVLSQADKDWK
ncbi:MAG: c-type cytochrome, partial [Nostoc sp.]